MATFKDVQSMAFVAITLGSWSLQDKIFNGRVPKRNTKQKTSRFARNKPKSQRMQRLEQWRYGWLEQWSTENSKSTSNPRQRSMQPADNPASSSITKPSLQSLLLSVPGEVRNIIYSEAARPPWGYIDINKPSTYTSSPLLQLDPLIVSEYRGIYLQGLSKATFVWNVGRKASKSLDFAPWSKWLEGLENDEAAHIRTIFFRTPPFELKLVIIDQAESGGKIDITYTWRKRPAFKLDPWDARVPFEGFQEQLDEVAGFAWESKQKLQAVAEAMIEQVDICSRYIRAE